MASKKFLISFLAVLAIAILAVASTSALEINNVKVKGLSASSNIAVEAGETFPVEVQFSSTDLTKDVVVTAYISGYRAETVETKSLDVYSGGIYTKTLSVTAPSKLSSSVKSLDLRIFVEGDGTEDADTTVTLMVQRESYAVQLLDVTMDPTVKAGSVLPVDVVLKNRGSHFAEDNFVIVSIPALGVAEQTYFGDLSDVDNSTLDKEDAAEGKVFLKIPRDAPTGVYLVQIEAYNGDTTTKATEKIAIVGASQDTDVLTPVTSKTVSPGETTTFSVTLVNAGNNVAYYELVPETTSGLNVGVSDSLVVIPAGTSKTVTVSASAAKAGTNSFALNVNSGSELVKKVTFTLNAQGSSFAVGNATVLLTVILAIIFIVLLVVLIVLLTRKPEKTEEFGESYY